MTVQTDVPGSPTTTTISATTTSPPMTPPPRNRPRLGAWVIGFVLLAIVVGLGALWWLGALRSKPHVALVTSGEGPYWDLVIAGANEAARQYDVELTVVR